MKIFVDTAPFIYLIENHPKFVGKVKKAITDAIVNGDELVTIVITFMEFGVKPEKENRQDLITKFEELVERLNIDILTIDKETGRRAYKLRAKYDFLKGMDALQLALSIKEQCSTFITNDKKLKKITEIQVKTLDDF